MDLALTATFNKAIEPLFKSTIITADIAIGNFLAVLTTTPQLYAVMREVNEDFSFRTEFAKAVVATDKGKTFILPPNKKKTIALINRLLYDFIRNKDSIVDFVLTYFKAPSNQESYALFLNNIVRPYASAYMDYLTGGDAIAVEEVVLDETSPVTSFADTAIAEVTTYIESIKDTIQLSSDFTDNTRAELTTLLDGTIYVLESRNAVLMKTAYVGLKNTLILYRIGLRELKEIERLFVAFGVI